MKLFSTIVDSTIWREEAYVKVVWVTMLAKADRNGYVFVSVPGLADAARVTLEQCVDSIAKLSAPDQWSRTKTNEGRRIREIDGGFELLNYLKYRELRSEEERRLQTREAVARHRVKKAKALTVSNVSQGKPGKAHAEADPIGRSKEEDQIPPGDSPAASANDIGKKIFVEEWEKQYREKYPFVPKDGIQLAALLKASPEVGHGWRGTVKRYLADPWWAEHGRHGLAALCANVVKFSGPVKPVSKIRETEHDRRQLEAVDKKSAEVRGWLKD